MPERSISMLKDFCFSLALLIAIALSTQGTYAAWHSAPSQSSLSYIGYLNPLPYVGIGENKTNFSLNPFTGFKNCNNCKIKRTADCSKKMRVCPGCKRAFKKNHCVSCRTNYVMPIIQPKCTSCGY